MTQVWNRELSDSIIEAFNCGYRLVDTSAAYRNEEAIGRAIRNQMFLVEKFSFRQE